MRLLSFATRAAAAISGLFTLVLSLSLLPKATCDGSVLIADGWANRQESVSMLYWLDTEHAALAPHRRIVINPDELPHHQLNSSVISPDHQRVLYQLGYAMEEARLAGSEIDLYAVDCDGANLHTLTEAGDAWLEYSPAWSPDSRQVVYAAASFADRERTDGQYALFVVNADGTGRRLVYQTHTVRPSWVHWTPRGILFMENNDLRLLYADGRVETVQQWGDDFPPRVIAPAPDQQPVLLGVVSPAAGQRLFLIDAEHDRFMPLIDQSFSLRSKVFWSPDATRIAFVDGVDNAFVLVVLDVETRQLREVISDSRYFQLYGWTATSDALVVNRYADGVPQFFRIDLSGNSQQLTHFPAD